MADFSNVPNSAKLWKIGDSFWVVWAVPGSDPAVPIGWRVGKKPDAVITPDGDATPDRTFKSMKGARRNAGFLDMGTHSEIAHFDDNPFKTFKQDYKEQAEANPMLKDPEVMAVFAGATLEGRQPTQAELTQTDWWQSRTDAEREWATLNLQDPQSARQRKNDIRREVQAELRERGVDAPGELVDLLANRWVSGRWTESMTKTQIMGLADPAAGINLAPPVVNAARGFDASDDKKVVKKGRGAIVGRLKDIFEHRGLDAYEHFMARGQDPEERLENQAARIESGKLTFEEVRRAVNKEAGLHPAAQLDLTREGEERVRQELADWLGPALAQQYGDKWVRKWAGKLRNEPDAEEQLTDKLRTLREAAFPEWNNPNLRYSDVAPTAQSLFQKVWQQDPDETEPLFMDVLRMSGPGGEGLHAAASKLRKEGLRRRVAPLVQEVSAGVSEATGGSVRQSVI